MIGLLKKCVLAASAIAVTPAYAQVAPTDNDLRAAYCIGRINAPPLDVDQFPPAVRSQLQHLNEQTENTLRRLRTYVLPKLYQLDPDAMILANKQGEAARQRTGDMMNRCLQDKADRECVRDMQDIKNCREATFLPF